MILQVETMCPDTETADRLAEALLDRRLIACANRGAEVTSLYRWEGRTEREGEVPLFLKTRTDLGDAVEAAIRDLHPYDVPPILRWQVRANADYAAWVAEETAEAGTPPAT